MMLSCQKCLGHGRYGARLFQLLVVAALNMIINTPALHAKCTDGPAPTVDWSGCFKELLMLGDYDLSRANLEGALLSGTDFRSTRLIGANFVRTELLRTAFNDADLSGANFEKALSSRANFAGAKLRNVRLVKAEFHRVNFEGADLTGADLSDGDFHRTNFSKAKLTNAMLVGALLPRSVFLEADLSGASMTGAFLYRANIEGADLTAVKDLTQAQLEIACGNRNTKLPTGLSAPGWWPCKED